MSHKVPASTLNSKEDKVPVKSVVITSTDQTVEPRASESNPVFHRESTMFIHD